MKFEIPFKTKTYLRQVEVIVPFVYSDLIKKVKISLIIGSLLIIIGSILLFNNEDSGLALVLISLFVLYYTYQKNNLYNQTKIAYIKIMMKNIVGLKTGVFEFLPDSLVYKDDSNLSTINWTDFKGYKVVKSNLLLIVNQKNIDMLVIGEEEIGVEKFKETLAFVKQHIK